MGISINALVIAYVVAASACGNNASAGGGAGSGGSGSRGTGGSKGGTPTAGTTDAASAGGSSGSTGTSGGTADATTAGGSGGGETDSGTSADATPGTAGTDSGGALDMDGPTTDEDAAAPSSGGNSVTGSGDGAHPFGTIAQAWWVGKPDPGPSGNVVDTVVYLLSKPFPCTSMGPGSGWDAKVPAGTQVVELKLAWSPSTNVPTHFPAHYAVTDVHGLGSAPPPPGMAFALWVIGPVVGKVVEMPASGQDVTLTALNAGTNLVGSFDLVYGAHPLTGTFDAAYCATGGEP